MKYFDWIEKLNIALHSIEITNSCGDLISPEEGFRLLINKTAELHKHKGSIYFAGNGASASMASHFALDFWKNGKVKAYSFSDLSQVTAISNDYSYDEVFSFPLDFFSNEQDIFVGISSSGNSENVIRAARKAKEKNLITITLTGFKPDNKLRKLGDLSIFIPEKTYGYVESAHAACLHFWLDEFIAQFIN
jgi:D-sedoheptulose 7-phosphate isomerase